MSEIDSSGVNGTIAAEPVDCVVCEDRLFVAELLMRWLEKSGRYKPTHVFSPNCVAREHPKASLCLISAQLASPWGSILPHTSSTTTVIFDDNFSDRTAIWWKERGAKGLLDLRDGPEAWLSCLHVVLGGGSEETPSAKKALQGGNERIGLQVLSPREMEVAQLLVRGLSAEQVAKKLGTTQGTVKNQRKAVYEKLKIMRATQLPWAMGNGIGKKP